MDSGPGALPGFKCSLKLSGSKKNFDLTSQTSAIKEYTYKDVKSNRIQFYHSDSYARLYQNNLLESLGQLDIM